MRGRSHCWGPGSRQRPWCSACTGRSADETPRFSPHSRRSLEGTTRVLPPNFWKDLCIGLSLKVDILFREKVGAGGVGEAMVRTWTVGPH